MQAVQYDRQQMRTAITGAGGLVATALARALGGEVRELRHADLDVSDREAVLQALAGFDVVFHCAVVGVDAAEDDPERARRVNIDGAANVAAAAPVVVHFSTNYVFDGSASRPYTIADEPHPINRYGRTKLLGEWAVLAANRRAVVIRTSWVFGPGGNNFLSTAPRRLRAGERVESIEDVEASVTYAPDLARAALALVERPGLHHLVNEGVCSYADFAQEAARLAGADPALVVRVRSGAVMRAPRPRYTPMAADVAMRSWQEALAEYCQGAT